MAENKVIIQDVQNKVIVSSPGPAGEAGRTILNGSGAPAGNLGFIGDFYYDTVSTNFYGPKIFATTWTGATVYPLQQQPSEFSYEFSWELAQVTGPVLGVYSVVISHNLGFKPNVTVKTSSGDVLETGIDYNSNDQLTLTMAQPFSGTAILS